eukprot:2504566-Amphidinium_carterae.1
MLLGALSQCVGALVVSAVLGRAGMPSSSPRQAETEEDEAHPLKPQREVHAWLLKLPMPQHLFYS